ncbi:unnamed protein product [Urochloa humidicola]
MALSHQIKLQTNPIINPHKPRRETTEDEPNRKLINQHQPTSGAEAADEARQVQVAVVVVRGRNSAATSSAAVEVDEVLGAGAVEVLVDEVLDVDEAVDAAWDGDGALVAEPVLALGLVEQRAEERVLEVAQRHGEAPLLLPLRAHPHRHAPLGHHLLLLVLPVHDPRQAGQIEIEASCLVDQEEEDGG